MGKSRNYFILSEIEIFETKTFLENDKFPYHYLELTSVLASPTDESTILYIVNLSSIDKDTGRKIVIKPVKKQQTIIKISCEKIIKCNDKIYEVKGNCNP